MRFWRIIRLALEGLRRTPLRFTLTALGVMIATGALVSMVAFAKGVQARAETPFKLLGLFNNIEVSSKISRDRDRRGRDEEEQEEEKREIEGESEPDELPRVLDDDAIAEIERIPEVDLAYPDFRFVRLEVKHGERSERALTVGLPREVSFLSLLTDVLVAGDFFSQTLEPEAVLGNRLAEELGFESPTAAVGQTITIEASGLAPETDETFAFEKREIPITVVGVYEPPSLAPGFAAGGMVLPVDVMKTIPGIRFSQALDSLRAGGTATGGGYPRVIVRVERPADLEPVREKIEEMGFRARTVMSRIEEMRTFFVVMDLLLASIGTVALVVAGLGIINTLLMSVLERFQEIGIYKAIGASDGDVRILFLTEAGLVGLVGGVAGLGLARVVTWILGLAINAYARGEGVHGDLVIFLFPLWVLVGAVAFSVAVSVLAGVYPASRAARVDPIRALRGE
jgi:putative ABC transport system permease protein